MSKGEFYWKSLIIDAMDRFNRGDTAQVEDLAKYLAEVDQARQKLRDNGYGVSGTPIMQQVDEVLQGLPRG